MNRRTYITLAALVCCLPVLAAQNSRQRVHAFAALPDWTGIWEWNQSDMDGTGEIPVAKMLEILRTTELYGHPPYNAAWDAKYRAASAALAAQRASGKAIAAEKDCMFGFPAQMAVIDDSFQLMVAPEQTVMLFERHEQRNIYTDGRPHPSPDDLWPTPEGDSIGHWEGETLVVDTIAREAGPIGFLATASPLSKHAHFKERIRMLNHDELEDQLTIEDPQALIRPWKMIIGYRRVTGLDRFIGFDCTHDRNPLVNGKWTIAPP
jgi:hypothetical protein